MENLERFLFRKAKETKLPSLAVAVVKNGDLVYSNALGYADLERRRKATTDTLYGIGSISKSFTCLAIMKLSEEGKLSLDDPVSKYVPFDANGATISNLMSHSSGIPGLGYAEALIRQQVLGAKTWLSVADVDDLITFMEGVKDWHLLKPGERWFYLNEGYEILERIVEVVSKRSYKEYLKEEIFKPLGINCLFLEDFGDEFAAPHYPENGEIKRANIPGGPMNGAGGIARSAVDLARYGYMFAAKDERVVSRKSIEDMEKPRIKIPYEIPYGEYHYGYGLMIMSDFFGREIIGHGGSVLVYTAHMLYSRSDDISVAVLSNSTGYPMKLIALYTLSYFTGMNPEELSFVREEKIYSKLVGTYKTYGGTIEGKVRKNWDFLVLELFEDITSSEIILIPQEIDERKSIFYTLSYGSMIPVEFVQKGDKTILIYERYVLEKI